MASASDINETKANMDHIYGQPDPRGYFAELREVGYAIPDAARPIFRALINQLQRGQRAQLTALDLGCSYGINAALLKHDLTMDDLYSHWTAPGIRDAAPDDVLAVDRAFFARNEAADDLTMLGLDPSAPAITYAEEAGLLDKGFALNLEQEPLPAAAAQAMGRVDLVMSTGCVGYVTETSFDKLMPAITQGHAPWIANFVLRMFPFDDIAARLERWGYVTEKLESETFVQRRFASDEEQAGVIEHLKARGLDPAAGEADGKLVAEFFLSRPEAEAQTPIRDLLAA